MSDIQGAYDHLGELKQEIGATEEHLRALFSQRRTLFVELLAAGERQATVAKAAGVTPMAVSFAVNGPARRHA